MTSVWPLDLALAIMIYFFGKEVNAIFYAVLIFDTEKEGSAALAFALKIGKKFAVDK